MTDTMDAAQPNVSDAALADVTIRELVNDYPATMEILAPLRIDLCCGGAHRLGEALDLHGIERTSVLADVASVVAASSAGRACHG